MSTGAYLLIFFGGEKKQGGARNWEIGTDTREDPLEEESTPTPVFSPGEPQGQRSLQATVQGSQRLGHN